MPDKDDFGISSDPYLNDLNKPPVQAQEQQASQPQQPQTQSQPQQPQTQSQPQQTQYPPQQPQYPPQQPQYPPNYNQQQYPPNYQKPRTGFSLDPILGPQQPLSDKDSTGFIPFLCKWMWAIDLGLLLLCTGGLMPASCITLIFSIIAFICYRKGKVHAARVLIILNLIIYVVVPLLFLIIFGIGSAAMFANF